MILPNFVANEFRYFHATNEYFKLVFILQWYEIRYFAFPWGKITAKETLFHQFGFLFNVSRFHRSILAIATCVICFTRKISRVHRSVVM